MAEFRLVSSEPTLKTKIFDVTHDRAEHPSGAVLDRHIVVNAPSAVMCARKPNGDVLLIRQFRLPMRQYLWELPAGRCDPGEDVLETAKRELIEETGYRAEKWTRLIEFFPAPGFASELMTAFLAEDLTEGESEPEPYELIETRWTPWAEALEMVRNGSIRDAKTVAALLYCQTLGPQA
ncbi:MAG: NUDIX hydrolase [Bryobacterales bacterium]